MPALDLAADPVALTAALVDVPSVSGDERALADAVEGALRALPHLEVRRDGDAVLARTHLDRERRVLLAGHLDTVPVAGNLPGHRDGNRLYGCGTSDMKAGDAMFLHLVATLPAPRHDLTLVLYDCEEVEAERNGLGRIERELPEWLTADLALLGEPTDGLVEAGCQGTLRVEVRTQGRRAHSARSWLGDNAVHRAAEVLDRLRAYEARQVEIDGCRYREGLQAVGIVGGVAGNIVPDECVVTVNFRFAPDRTVRRCGAARPRGLRRVAAHRRRRRRRRSPGAGRPRCGGVPRCDRHRAARQVRLDGRVPVRCARHPRPELRPR